MKSIIDNLMRDIPANVETIVFPKDAYFQLLAEINALQDRIKFSTGTIKVAEHKIEEQAARIAQLTQWLESAENACHEKDDEIARLKPAANTREEKAREQRMAAMGCKTIYARNGKGIKVAAIDVPVSHEERIKALCAELTQMKAAVDQEHDRYLEARREVERLNKRLQAANSEALDSKTSLLAAQQGLTDLNDAYEHLRTTVQQLVKQKTELEEQLNKSKSANKLIITQRNALQHAVAHPAKDDQLEAELAHLKQENARMTIQLENARREIEDRQKTVEMLRLRNDRLDQRINEHHTSLQAELNNTQRELRAACEARDYYMSLIRTIRDAVAPTAEHK